MNLGRAIALCRKQRGLTQAALAQRAGLSVSYLSLLEQNKRTDPTLTTMHRLSDALHLPLGILFYLAAEKSELSGLDPDLLQRLSHAALSMLNQESAETSLF